MPFVLVRPWSSTRDSKTKLLGWKELLFFCFYKYFYSQKINELVIEIISFASDDLIPYLWSNLMPIS